MKTFTIFLDVDGVLNHHVSPGWKNAKHNKVLDNDCLDNYRKLLEFIESKGYQLQIILSSTWRTSNDHKKALRDHGINWHKQTPDERRLSEYLTRSEEIQRFLDENTDLGIGNQFLILDDMVSTDSFLGNVVQTYWDNGGFDSYRLNLAVEMFLKLTTSSKPCR